MEYTSGYPTRAAITIATLKPSSNPIDLSSLEPDFIKRGSQEAQVILERYLMIYILNIISSLSSRKRPIHMRQRGSLRIPHISVRET